MPWVVLAVLDGMLLSFVALAITTALERNRINQLVANFARMSSTEPADPGSEPKFGLFTTGLLFELNQVNDDWYTGEGG